jgi:NAD(P)-dependent dehydrogenase (short-subunit alcohol dehydrogenase family)
MGRVNGKVVLVTGGAMGMGKSHSELLAAEGAHVFVCDIDAEKGRQVVDDIGGKGGTAEFIKLKRDGVRMNRFGIERSRCAALNSLLRWEYQ